MNHKEQDAASLDDRMEQGKLWTTTTLPPRPPPPYPQCLVDACDAPVAECNDDLQNEGGDTTEIDESFSSRISGCRMDEQWRSNKDHHSSSSCSCRCCCACTCCQAKNDRYMWSNHHNHHNHNHLNNPVYQPLTKTPRETLYAIYQSGQAKAALPWNLLVVHSVMAGIYIAMASHLYLAVGGGVLGAALFPTGLIAVVLTSAELFTGDALVFVAALLGGKVRFSHLLRNWTVAWLGNFAGCIFWASLVALATDSLEDLNRVELALAVAQKKALQPWSHILVKAMGANFMVCLGVWQATCSADVAGKILALWFPIAGFVLLGFEHVVANQFLLPVAMMYGGRLLEDDQQVLSVGELWYALSAATVGNVLGGGVLLGAVYWYALDSSSSSSWKSSLSWTTPLKSTALTTTTTTRRNDNANNKTNKKQLAQKTSTSSATTAREEMAPDHTTAVFPSVSSMRI
ncbi:hypothetical protein ACA910_011177 [Epithemia clementina (nom. ined.)]